MTTLSETRPKESGGSGGLSRDETVQLLCKSKLPGVTFSYPDTFIFSKIKELTGPRGYPGGQEKGKGDKIPLNIFLSQELQRMNRIINLVKKTFSDIIEAVDGQIIMTPQIVDAIDALYDRRVPKSWLYDLAGTEISWLKPNFSLWFQSFNDRNLKLDDWIKGNRPKFFNLDNYFNPNGFLTSMKQEVVRIRKANQKGKAGLQENWSMDAVDYKVDVLEKNKDMKDFDLKKGLESGGVWIEGLTIEGADTDKKSCLIEATGKGMLYKFPIVQVSA